MMKKTFLLSVGLLVSLIYMQAQQIVLVSGSLTKLGNEKFFLIEYDYSNMRVGKFEKEEDYIEKKVNEYNEKEAGRGDKWKKSWINDRKGRFQPKCEELFNKYLEKAGVYIGEENQEAKYTMILKTTFTEPGFNVVVHRKPALIDVELLIVETKNHNNVVAHIVSQNNPGTAIGGADYDTGIRIQEAYAKCGKELSKYLYKNVWK